MKPLYVVMLMGAAALGGGLVVRYSERPADLTLSRPVPPNVVAPPVAPTVRVGPSTSVPVQQGPAGTVAKPPAPQPQTAAPQPKPQKPSAFNVLVHIGKPESVPPTPAARRSVPADPPAVTILERPKPAPLQPAPVAAKPSPEPAPEPAPAPAAPAPNRATLREGMLITVRINEALSSNLNSPGDVFSGRLEKPLIADGFVIAERGAHVRGEVVESKAGEIAIRLREIVASDGQRVHVVSLPWRKQGGFGGQAESSGRNVYDAPLTRDGAAVIRPATSITFKLDQTIELTERR